MDNAILNYRLLKMYKVQKSDLAYFGGKILNISFEETNIDSFIIYVCTKGSFEIALSNTTYIVKKGETILVPACMKDITLKPHQSAEILEVYY